MFCAFFNRCQRLFQQAVNRQLVSDVEIGCYLSGGMDSGTITALSSKELPYIKTFTCGFDLSSASGIELAFDAVPRGIDIDLVETALKEVSGVVAIHDLHVWGMSTSETSLTAHLLVSREADQVMVLRATEAVLRQNFHISHSTIQLESAPIPS